MKHFQLFFFLTVILLSGCSNFSDEDLSQPKSLTNTTFSTTRSLQEAVEIAKNAINEFGEVHTRASVKVNKRIDLGNIKAITTNAMTRSTSSSVQDTLLYVVNYAHNKGFAIISANKATEGLLAYTEQGSYDPDSDGDKDLGGFTDFINKAKAYVEDKTLLLPLPYAKTKHSRDTIYYHDIKPKVSVQWGQHKDEGAYAPNGVAGCVNTAMAQIMSHFYYPTYISLTFDNAPYTNVALDWNDIMKHKTSHDLLEECNASNEAHTAIGLLHRQLGLLNHSNYLYTKGDPRAETGTSIADIGYIIQTFNQLGYTTSPNFTAYEGDCFASDLSNNKIIYMLGTHLVSGDISYVTYGHAWVVDGVKAWKFKDTLWKRYDTELEWRKVEEVITTASYLHVNWGFYGDCNGYFKAGVFAMGAGHPFDNTYSDNNQGNLSFNYDLKYITVTH